MASQYKTRKVAAPNTLEHRIYIEKDGVPVSPFHDIPLYANEAQTILNMVVEIPRWTNGKLEISKVRENLLSFYYTLELFQLPLIVSFTVILPRSLSTDNKKSAPKEQIY
jgi:inorganic pyrophosphatase